MKILKIKEWVKSKSDKQFKPLMIANMNLIIKVERISDGKKFEIDERILTQHAYINNEFKEISVYIHNFLPDNVHVTIFVGTNGNPYRIHGFQYNVEINSLEGAALVLADSLSVKLAQ